MITQDENKQLTPAVQTYLLLRDAGEVDLGVSVAEIEAETSYWGWDHHTFTALNDALDDWGNNLISALEH